MIDATLPVRSPSLYTSDIYLEMTSIPLGETVKCLFNYKVIKLIQATEMALAV